MQTAKDAVMKETNSSFDNAGAQFTIIGQSTVKE
jgi:hypothetical protein